MLLCNVRIIVWKMLDSTNIDEWAEKLLGSMDGGWCARVIIITTTEEEAINLQQKPNQGSGVRNDT